MHTSGPGYGPEANRIPLNERFECTPGFWYPKVRLATGLPSIFRLSCLHLYSWNLAGLASAACSALGMSVAEVVRSV